MQDKSVLPEELISTWNLFIEISKGCDRITYNDLDAFQRVTATQLTPWEASIMVKLDNMRRKHG